jgi:hypothetical protein
MSAIDAPRLAMVELLDRDGAVAHRVPVTRWPVSVGRALDCDVVLDDPHAAPRHAVIEDAAAGGRPLLRVGDTRNGVRLGGRLLAAGASAPLPAGAAWQVGRSSLRLRLVDDPLPAELPLAAPSPARARVLAAGLLLLLLWLAATHWLESDPDDPLGDYLPVLVTTPMMLFGWCFVWALGSKVFVRHFDFPSHLRLALSVLLAALVLGALLPMAAFATSWVALVRAGELLTLALGCGLVFGHLALILPSRRRALAAGFATMFVVGAGLKLLLHEQRTDRWFDTLYLSALGPPGLRLAAPVATDTFIEEARSLRRPLDDSARRTGSPPWLPADEEE